MLDLELFSTISGLKLNSKKTEALWIGCYTGRVDQLCPEKNLKWVKDKTKSLGVWISTNPTISINESYREKLEKIRSCLNCWEYRRLTLLGKIVVLKSLIASQLVYMLSPLLKRNKERKRKKKSFPLKASCTSRRRKPEVALGFYVWSLWNCSNRQWVTDTDVIGYFPALSWHRHELRAFLYFLQNYCNGILTFTRPVD